MNKICIFIAIGGSWANQARVPSQFRELGIKLSNKDFEVVYIIQGKPDPKLVDEVNVYYWPSKRPTKSIDAIFLYKLIKKYKPSLLITQFGATNIMLLLGWLMRVPHRIGWYHTLSKAIEDDWRSSKIKLRYLRFRKSLVYRFATCISFVSNYAQKDFVNTYFKPKVSVIFYNGMEKKEGSRHLPSQEIRRVCCVARLDISKGQDILIKAFKQVTEKVKEATLILIGDGPNKEYLVNLCSKLQLESFVTFEGSISPSEVIDGLRDAYISVLPSRMDNCPFAIIESIGLGIPVIASNVGGIPEIIRDGVDGFLIPPENTNALAEKIILLLSNSALAKQMSINAHQRFEEEFELTKIINQQADWFEDLLRKK